MCCCCLPHQVNREAPTLRFTSARHEVSAAAASTAALVDGFTPDRSDPDGLEAQVAALLGAAGSAAAAAMEEAEQALAEKVGGQSRRCCCSCHRQSWFLGQCTGLDTISCKQHASSDGAVCRVCPLCLNSLSGLPTALAAADSIWNLTIYTGMQTQGQLYQQHRAVSASYADPHCAAAVFRRICF